MRRLRSYLLLTLVIGVLAAWAGAVDSGRLFDTWGYMSDTESDTGNTITADTLNAPSAMDATAAGTSQVNLTWTASTDNYATGYQVFRRLSSGAYPGSPAITITETAASCITPGDTSCQTSDSGLTQNTGYCYKVRATYLNWLSPFSAEDCATTASATTNTGFHGCSSNAADTGGDNDGFEVNAAFACINLGIPAEDNNSGDNPGNSCDPSKKDRHRFYDYGFSIPTGSTINGIEVRLDAWSDLAADGTRMCVELSWDGGVNWTTQKETSPVPFTTSEQTYILGGTGDTWGRTWTAAQFSNANFRVRITNISQNNARDFRLDFVAVRVTYTAP